MTIYQWIISATWILFMIVWAVAAFRAKRTLNRNLGRRVLWRFVIVLLALVFFSSRIVPVGSILFAPFVFGPIVPLLGVALCVAGVALAIWARLHLGRNWGMSRSVKENPELVTSGPYRYIRHPIYTGLLMAFVGSAGVDGPWFLIVFVGACAYFIWSALKEEELMVKEFPNQYPAYKQRSKMLIPFVL